jgi:hypothetical protein
MQYLDQEGKVIYTAKGKKTSKVFPALEWMTAMYPHISNRGEQMVRYFNSYTPTMKKEVLINYLLFGNILFEAIRCGKNN